MARSRSARRARDARDPFIPDLFTVGAFFLRPEIVGTLLVVAAAAAVPFLFPLAGLFRDARDSVVQALGVHVFTMTLLLAVTGAFVAWRHTYLLLEHARHLSGAIVLLVFSAGVLGMWHPTTTVGTVDLAVHSAGGDVGAALSESAIATALWLATLPVGFALLWPLTTRRGLEALPGLLKWLVLATWDLIVWLGPHRLLWRGVRQLSLALWRAMRPTRSAEANAEAVDDDEEWYDDEEEEDLEWEEEEEPEEVLPRRKTRQAKAAVQIAMDIDEIGEWRHSRDGWQLPPIGVLRDSPVIDDDAPDNEWRAQLIVDTLASFGVDARVTQINEGPTVTQFGVEPGWDVRVRTVPERDASGQALYDEDGEPITKDIEVSRTRIRVNRITALQNDLALALATPALRIEAPVPGKSIVGIEVPNASASVVTLRSVIESPKFQRTASSYELPIALGSGVSGEPAVADLATMPHLLIAGATGSGKSVCLNAIITCLLMNHSPEQLRLILVDPKRVELTTFDTVPHLAFSKIVVDMDKVVGTLQAVINEMESRYRRFAQAGVRNIKRYNEVTEHNKMAYWVTVIDELADLMMAAPYQVEQQLVRLAQLGRAAGIHMIIATQRPSVDVVTGLIKANFPTRIAFAMSSQVDSRTVLDQGGAEKLLGRGDMLYVATDAQKPTRLQGVYVSDAEIEAVVDFWTDGRFEELAPEKHDDLLDEAERALEEAQEPAEEDDPMMVKAIELARESRRMSTSMLQRRLRVGYPRAARIMDELELRGVVGPPDGSGGSREVLLDDADEEDGEAETILPQARPAARD
jgi:S-DNA-T family DNA segregation ATPase FtsK/SpoIIIE